MATYSFDPNRSKPIQAESPKRSARRGPPTAASSYLMLIDVSSSSSETRGGLTVPRSLWENGGLVDGPEDVPPRTETACLRILAPAVIYTNSTSVCLCVYRCPVSSTRGGKDRRPIFSRKCVRWDGETWRGSWRDGVARWRTLRVDFLKEDTLIDGKYKDCGLMLDDGRNIRCWFL